MPDRIETLLDHAAELQREVNRLNEEVLALAVAGLALAFALMFLSWKLWHA